MMYASSVNLVTRGNCHRSAFGCVPAAATAGAYDDLHRGGFPNFNQIPLRSTAGMPLRKRKQGQYLQYPAVVRTLGTALRPEQILTRPIEPGSWLRPSWLLLSIRHSYTWTNAKTTLQISPGHNHTSTIEKLVPLIKENLSCTTYSLGEISVSAYDTAWVARIPDANGSDGPHFPGTLDWMVANQHPDGSWGDQKEWLYDRFIQTLACIVALKSWNHSSSAIERGVDYVIRNADRLEDEEMLCMPIGFELAFPALLDEAKCLGLNLPYDTPFFGVVAKIREKKLQRVPLELLHSQPTTLLHTLEGLQTLDIDWAKVLEFQAEDGSICCSPAATAVLYMRTGNRKSLSFLESTVRTFNHAVPTCYTLDTFQNLWVVDTLERLGISRYFKVEIEQVLAKVYREWSDDEGICWSSMLKGVPDLDDTSMAFRLLREHGYKVSAEGFKGFQKGKAFACFPVGQMVQGVSDMFNLYRASQTAYPGEERLADAESFSRGFLIDALTNKKADADKWSLKKDMAGEVEYVLMNPESKSLNRMKVRHYLDKYGPEDVWIGKSIYRLPLVNNSEYLQLAKADYNLCLMSHKKELRQILRWISDFLLPETSNLRERIVTLYAMLSAELWEPDFSTVRKAAGKCMFIAMAIHHLFVHQPSLTDLRQLVGAWKMWDPTRVNALPEHFSSCFMVLYNTINEAVNESTTPEDLMRQLVLIWEGLLSSFLLEAEWRAQPTVEARDEGLRTASATSGLKVIVFSSILMSGEIKTADFVRWLEKPDSETLLLTVSRAVGLAQGIASKKEASAMQLEEPHFTMMQHQINKELNLHLGHMSGAPSIVKRVFLSLTKVANCYYGGP